MEETDPFLDPNPFAALDGDDGVQHTPTQQASPPLQQPLSSEELELEAINAQQGALLQASSELSPGTRRVWQALHPRTPIRACPRSKPARKSAEKRGKARISTLLRCRVPIRVFSARIPRCSRSAFSAPPPNFREARIARWVSSNPRADAALSVFRVIRAFS